MSCAECEQRAAAAGTELIPEWVHLLLGRLDRQTELLAQVAGPLATHRQRPNMGAVGNANNVATATYPVPGGVDLIWQIERWTFSTNSAQANPVVSLFVMDSIPLNANSAALDDTYLEDTSTLKRGAINESSAPIFVKGGEVVLVQWTGIVNGDICKSGLQLKQSWQAQD
jgi:hypothetical protein